jgi:hypothetical protein
MGFTETLMDRLREVLFLFPAGTPGAYRAMIEAQQPTGRDLAAGDDDIVARSRTGSAQKQASAARYFDVEGEDDLHATYTEVDAPLEGLVSGEEGDPEVYCY